MTEPLDPWLERLDAAPDDEGLRAVFADWCEENDRGSLGAWLREEHRASQEPSGADRTRFAELTEALPPALAARLSRPPVENCRPQVPLSVDCPRRWTSMQHTEDPAVRHCTACSRPVYWVGTMQSAIAHAVEGHCIAVSPHLRRRPGDLEPPRPVPWPPEITPPPGTVAAVPLVPDGLPEPPIEPPNEPQPEQRSWWRRLLGLD